MSQGKFITFEGGEGAGKSTQARLLCEALERRGMEVVATREPGGTKGAEAIRNLLLDPPGGGWNMQTEALLFAAARGDHVARVILPALRKGKWVVCDRFIDSSRAYQGGAGKLPDDAVMALHRVGSGNLIPDATILLEPGAEELARRLAKRDPASVDAIEGRAREYHEGVAKTFHALARSEPERFVRIASNGSKDDTHTKIMSALEPLLEAWR